MRIFLIILCLVAIFTHCSNKSKTLKNKNNSTLESSYEKSESNEEIEESQIVRRTDEPDIYHVGKADPKMINAINTAKKTVSTFITNLKNPKKNQRDFVIKTKFVDGENYEHIWIKNVKIEGYFFTGTIDNVPNRLTNIKFGQKVQIHKKDISDWKFVENGKLVGGYTIRVIRDKLSEEQRKKLDSQLDFIIE